MIHNVTKSYFAVWLKFVIDFDSCRDNFSDTPQNEFIPHVDIGQ
jgi:hypothetical protein